MVSMLNMEKKWVFLLVITSLICTILVVTCFDMGLISSVRKINSIFSIFPAYISMTQRKPGYAESKIKAGPLPPSPGPEFPRFAYLVSGSKGDLEKLWRTLHVLYHPRNQSKDWDWFINLSASDYPFVTQDDLIYAFSDLDRNLNFIEHTSHLGWKADKRAMPLIMDPGLYMSTKSDIFWTSQKRKLPTAFKLFTVHCSAWTVMSHSFVEFCVWGWDNLPRTLLMYYTNSVSSPEGYFQTVVCNAPEFATTVVNHDLHYISWDNPPKQYPHILTLNESDMMVQSNAAFALKFNQDDAVLNKIDKDLLGREKGSFTPGGWCTGKPKCSEVGDLNKIKPGPGAQRLHKLIATSSSKAILDRDQCK
ncbi:3'-5'-exoribonuclease family protein [Hibiscus syriacus]|uniref:3'-5'-exoribonuclease family protein n=1 Tax=Hibiscus syriacus TaxID=106335 RepID=A0A6A2YKN8_HIBSY|nr:3'-5'-exoribonuclease family protein [Hibiscus syriacus]